MGEHDDNAGPPRPPLPHDQYGDGVDVACGFLGAVPAQAWDPWRFVLWQLGIIAYAVACAATVRWLYPSWLAFYLAFGLPLIAIAAIRSSLSRPRRKPDAAEGKPSSAPAPRPRGIALGALVVYLCAAMTSLSMLGWWAGGSPWDAAIVSGLTGYWLMAAAMIGVTSGLMGRGGATLTCRRCGARCSPGVPWARVGPGCPDCHLPWKLPPETLRRLRLSRRDVAGYGATAAVAIVVMAMIPVGRNLLPTSMLIRSLGTAREAPNSAWDELQSRTLTPEQKSQVFMHLADRRERGLALPYGSEDWVRDQLYALRTDLDTFSHYFPGWFDLELVPISNPAASGAPAGPDITMNAGARLDVELAVANYDEAMSALLPLIYIEGFWVGEDRASIQHAQTTALYQAGTGEGDRYWEATIGLRGPRARFVLDQPGRNVVRAAVWLVVPANRSETPQITWNADGTLNAPNALHVERRELVLPVEVR